MRIGEFCKKYGVHRRSVDYWTTLGLLHPEPYVDNSYRNYGEQAEREIREILIVQTMNDGRVTKSDVEKLRKCGTNRTKWERQVIDKIAQKRQEIDERNKTIMEYARDFARGVIDDE